MSLKTFNVDVAIAEALYPPETRENRITRSQLRLSSNWKVLGRTIGSPLPELCDEYPDLPLVPEDGETYEGDVIIHIAWNGSGAPRCPQCGHRCRILGYETRLLRHVDDLKCRCFVHAEVPKYDCDICGRKLQQRIPLARPNVSYTRFFAMDVIRRLREGTMSAVAKDLATSRNIVGSILHTTIHRALPEFDASDVSGVYLDETQFGSGHDYISVFTDQHHRVIYICRGHGKEVLELFRDFLVAQGGDPENIRFFSADMSKAYEAGVMAIFPNATLVWDRFHLMKAINEALNDIRKGVVRRDKGEPLKLVKYTLMYRRSRMKRKHVERLRTMRSACPELGLAFDMKEAFAEIIKVPDPDAMTRALKIWIDWVMLDGPEQFRKKAEVFRSKMGRITSWTRFRLIVCAALIIRRTPSAPAPCTGWCLRPRSGARSSSRRGAL